jgi:hypothetical protein
MRRKISAAALSPAITVAIIVMAFSSTFSRDRLLPAPGTTGSASDAASGSFAGAWRLSRGERVSVAVVATDSSVAALVRSRAPASEVIHENPGSDGRHAKERPVVEDASLARSVESVIAKNPRVLLVALARPGSYPRTEEALARADSRGILIVAPAGDEGLSQERIPASVPGVLSVATLTDQGFLADTANVGPRTTLSARAATSVEAAAQVAAVAALAFGYDARLTSAEVRRALEGGELAARPRPRAGEAAVLEPASVLERLRPRARAVVLRDVRVVPFGVPEGEPARIKALMISVGRLPARGDLVATLPGGSEVRAPYGPLAPGEEREVELELVPRSTGSRVRSRTADGGVLDASPAAVTLCARSCAAIVGLAVLPPYQRSPALRIVRASVTGTLRVSVLVENTGPEVERSAWVKLAAGSGRDPRSGWEGAEPPRWPEVPVPVLACGERAHLELDASWLSRPGAPATVVEVGVELLRRPTGFRETLEDRRTLTIDPRPPGRMRVGAER